MPLLFLVKISLICLEMMFSFLWIAGDFLITLDLSISFEDWFLSNLYVSEEHKKFWLFFYECVHLTKGLSILTGWTQCTGAAFRVVNWLKVLLASNDDCAYKGLIILAMNDYSSLLILAIGRLPICTEELRKCFTLGHFTWWLNIRSSSVQLLVSTTQHPHITALINTLRQQRALCV